MDVSATERTENVEAIQLVLTTEEQVVAIPMPQIMGNSRRPPSLC